MAIFWFMMGLSMTAFLIHLFVSKKPKTKERLVELFLLYLLIFNVGLTSFIGFIGLRFLPVTVAGYLNWPTCPFQAELSNVNLAFSILGILCIWLRGDFWTATIIGVAIWWLGDGIGYFFGDQRNQGNVGPWMYNEILVSLLLLVLLFFYRRYYRKNSWENP